MSHKRRSQGSPQIPENLDQGLDLDVGTPYRKYRYFVSKLNINPIGLWSTLEYNEYMLLFV